jgi:hypothetical protein
MQDRGCRGLSGIAPSRRPMAAPAGAASETFIGWVRQGKTGAPTLGERRLGVRDRGNAMTAQGVTRWSREGPRGASSFVGFGPSLAGPPIAHAPLQGR